MDPNLYFALSSGFPQIVGLLATFYSIKNDNADLNEFKEWLDESNNDYAIQIIENNDQLQNSLSSFMNDNHEENMSKLSHLTELVINLDNKIEGIDKIASSFKSDNNLSKQAINVLRQFVNSNSSKMYCIDTSNLESSEYSYFLEGGSTIEYDELDFVESDILMLVEKGFITRNVNANNSITYSKTRQAVSFIESIDKSL